VSGVVFQVTASSPHREARGETLYFCCEACAAYFSENRDRVLGLRGRER
jgi:YHS domain-containing protein